MRVRLISCFTATLLGLARWSAAQDAMAPATQPEMPLTAAPTTAPAAPVVAIDTTTPRGTLKSFLVATQKGDIDLMRSLVLAETSTEKQMVDAMSHRAQADSKLRAAVVKAYGPGSATTLMGDVDAAATERLAQIDKAVEKVDGEKATVTDVATPTDPVPPVPLGLKKVDGGWKIPMSEFLKEADPKTIDQSLGDMEFFAQLIMQSADDVAAGKYKTPEEAGQGIRAQLMAAMMKRNAPPQPDTTQPATTQPDATTVPATP